MARASSSSSKNRSPQARAAAHEEASPGNLNALQQRLGYRFRDPQLLYRALIHRSFAAGRLAEQTGTSGHDVGVVDNERLEFLGDAVLGLRISECLLKAFPDANEGQLSRLRSWIVSARNLAVLAQGLELGKFLLLSKSEESVGGRNKERLLANALEAVIGAVHLDGGYRAASRILDRHVLGSSLSEISPEVIHEFAYKSALQEWSHAESCPLPRYSVVGSSGPEHDKTFIVEVNVEGIYRGQGQGGSKKQAEQQAARGALEFLGLFPASPNEAL